MSDEARLLRLLEAIGSLNADLSLSHVLQRLVTAAAEITGARYAALGVLGPSGVIEDFVVHGVTPEERAAIGAPPRGAGVLGLLITDPRPLRIDDITQHPASVGFPPNHPPMRSFLGVPVVSRGRVYGNLYVTEKRGAPSFTASDEAMLVLLAGQAGTAVANARLYADAERRSQWVDAVREIATSILDDGDPRAILDVVAARAGALALADGAAILSVPTPDVPPVVVGVSGAQAAHALATTLSGVGPAWTEVVARDSATVVEGTPAQDGGAQVAGQADGGPAVFVPLTTAQGGRTILVVWRTRGRERFDRDDVGVLESFATQASLVLAHARAQEDRRRLVLVEERERIAKDLHDGVIQSLFAIGMSLQATAGSAADEEIAQRLYEAVDELDRAVGELRSYIFGMHLGAALGRPLEEALEDAADDFQRRTGITTVADLDPGLARPLEPYRVDLLHIVREALSNVARHAQATTCRISLRRQENRAVLEVDDDGVGFDVSCPPARDMPAMGLTNLRTRAESLGGTLEVASAPGEGTTVRLQLPIPS